MLGGKHSMSEFQFARHVKIAEPSQAETFPAISGITRIEDGEFCNDWVTTPWRENLDAERRE
jgi:hypothetical protein